MYFYAVLYDVGEQSHLDVYKGLPWRKIHSWPVTFQGEPVKVTPTAVLKMEADDQQITFWWQEYVGYREAVVHQAVIYHRDTGKFSTSWSD